MIEAGAFYGGIAASSAAIFGVGAAFMATRLSSLAERANRLAQEHADLMNSLDPKIQTRWGTRGRRDALADLHAMSRDHRRAIRTPLGAAVALITASLAVLIGWPPDTLAFRIVLLAFFSAAGVVWVVLLDRIAVALIRVTRGFADERERERDEKTASGMGFLLSGDPKAFDVAIESLVPEERRTRSSRRALRKLKKAFRKALPPPV